jgi:HAMP domain-containing protein
MARSAPLRYTLPIGFLVVGLVLMTVAYRLRHSAIVQHNEDLIRQQADGLGHLIVPELESGFARGEASPGAAIFQRLHRVPHLMTALVCDESGLILDADDAALRGRRLTDAAPAAAALIARPPGERTPRFEFSADRAIFWAAFPLAAGPAAPGTARLGWFCMKSDAAAPLAPAFAAQRTGTLAISLLIFIIFVGLWYYFDRAVTRRIHALLHATGELAAGRLESRAVVHGSDEIAELGAAFNRMADQLEAREAAVQRSNRRATDAIQASGLGTWVWNVENGDCADNTGWTQILGYAPDEIGPQIEAWQALVHPEDLPAVMAAFRAHREATTHR